MTTALTQEVLLGCEPQVRVVLCEDEGNLFIRVYAEDENVTDIDALLFNMNDDAVTTDLTIYPEVDVEDVTGFGNAPGAFNQISNGAQTRDAYDVKVEFGTTAGSTGGDIDQAAFTLYLGSDAKMSLADIDLTSLTAIVNSDNGEGLALTAGDDIEDTGAVYETVTTEAMSEDFEDISDPADSDNVVSDDNWAIQNGAALTSGCRDGVLEFAEISAEGPVALSIDMAAQGLCNFEADGCYADSLRIEAKVDGGDWVLLDEFRVNEDNSAMVGSETGQCFGENLTTLTYSGEALDCAEDCVQFRVVSDITAWDEQVLVDNVEVFVTEEVLVEDEAEDDAEEDTSEETVADETAEEDDTAAEPVNEDFEGPSAGETAEDQFENFTIWAQRAGDDSDSENAAMIFDTANPTGRDEDLGFEDQGNALIISEDNDECDPDDNACGGTISFEFDTPTEVLSINMLDIEEEGGAIDLYDPEGALIKSVEIPAAGDNSVQTVEINAENVCAMDVFLVGSGAVDDLCYVPPVAEEPVAEEPVEDEPVDEDCDVVCDNQYEVDYEDLMIIETPDLPEECDFPWIFQEEEEEEIADIQFI
jgi:hypothetical protein